MKTFFTRNDNQVLTFKPFGDWADAVRTFSRLDKEIKVASIRAQEKMALVILKKVKDHLRKQDLPWRKLSKKYAAKKKKLGWDHRILIATSSYLNNITYWKRANGWYVYIGVKKGVHGINLYTKKKNPIDIATIAYIHEFSSGTKRYRPLWNPTIRELGNKPGIKALFLKHLKTELRRSGLRKYLYITDYI